MSAPKDGSDGAAERGPPPRETFRCFWHGPALSAYEILPLKSILARGHRVVLYRYDRTLALPEGVEAGDAQEILPALQVMRRPPPPARVVMCRDDPQLPL